MDKMDDIYKLIENYAEVRQLKNTKKALPVAKELLDGTLQKRFQTGDSGTSRFEHNMKATKMLINLHMLLSEQEEDILLTTMLCHDILTTDVISKDGHELTETYHFDFEVLESIKFITRPYESKEEQIKLYYERIKDSKIAVLVVLADQSSLVEQLSELSISDVNKFVHEMHSHLLPMCVYAKRYYRDCHMSVNIMMEKIRCLIDVANIISNRYQKREMAYTNEILSLMEENARLRGMIYQLEAGEIQ